MSETSDLESLTPAEPLISVIMNCFNGERFLKTAIDSVIAQSYRNWELIFWDNQSSDNSADIINEYDDERLRYFRSHKHTLLYEARNLAIKKSNGAFLTFLDADDWWEPSKLEKQILLFQAEDVGFACSKYWIFKSQNQSKRISSSNLIPSGWVLNRILENYEIGLLTLIVRRSAFLSIKGGFDPRLQIIGDFDIVVSLSRKWKMACTQEPLAFYRVHGDNLGAKEKKRQLAEYKLWVEKMNQYPDVRNSKGYRKVLDEIVYMEGVLLLNQKKLSDAWQRLLDLPLGEYKAKLFLRMFCRK